MIDLTPDPVTIEDVQQLLNDQVHFLPQTAAMSCDWGIIKAMQQLGFRFDSGTGLPGAYWDVYAGQARIQYTSVGWRVTCGTVAAVFPRPGDALQYAYNGFILGSPPVAGSENDRKSESF